MRVDACSRSQPYHKMTRPGLRSQGLLALPTRPCSSATQIFRPASVQRNPNVAYNVHRAKYFAFTMTTATPSSNTPRFSVRALYSPPALRSFAQLHEAPSPQDIALERFRQRLNVHKLVDYPPPHQVHRHFLTDARDRELATSEAVEDICDAVSCY